MLQNLIYVRFLHSTTFIFIHYECVHFNRYCICDPKLYLCFLFSALQSFGLKWNSPNVLPAYRRVGLVVSGKWNHMISGRVWTLPSIYMYRAYSILLNNCDSIRMFLELSHSLKALNPYPFLKIVDFTYFCSELKMPSYWTIMCLSDIDTIAIVYSLCYRASHYTKKDAAEHWLICLSLSKYHHISPQRLWFNHSKTNVTPTSEWTQWMILLISHHYYLRVLQINW